jgi:hypothetical protein
LQNLTTVINKNEESGSEHTDMFMNLNQIDITTQGDDRRPTQEENSSLQVKSLEVSPM